MDRKFEHIKDIENQYQLNTYKKLPISIEKGKGVYVYDTSGKKYLDLYGGHAVALIGHSHPYIVKAITEQANKLIFYSNIVYLEIRAKASEAIINIAPADINKVFFCNSGAEANETALKIARRFTGKQTIIAMKNSFHGRTIGALSATSLGNYRNQFSPIIDAFKFVEFGKISAIEEALTDDVAGIILEPIQSMAGVEIADDQYYKALRDICTDKGIVLIFDEIQTAFGRTGSWFFGDLIGVTPDLITCAKGIGAGIPVGAVLINEDISKTIKYGEHGSTFGGGPIASSAILANIEVIKKENFLSNALEVGNYIKENLKGIPVVKNVKGRGLLLGIELLDEAAMVRDYLLENGIITGTSAKKNVLRLLPPIILKKEDLGIFFEALKKYSK